MTDSTGAPPVRRSTGSTAHRVDRRTFIGTSLAAGAGLLAAACGGASPTVSKAASTAPAGSDLGAIEHVVYLMQENRSFDHYFGTYRGVRGFDDHPVGTLGSFAQPYAGNHTNEPVGKVLPFHLAVAGGAGECTHDLEHNWLAQHQCWNKGAMDAFVATHSSARVRGTRLRAPDGGLPHPCGSPLPLCAGRRLHDLRQLPLLGPGPHPSESPDVGVRDDRSGGAPRRSGADHQLGSRRPSSV